MTTDAAVTHFLSTAPTLPMPTGVAERLRGAIAGEVQLRQTAALQPSAETVELKDGSPLWMDDPVEDA